MKIKIVGLPVSGLQRSDAFTPRVVFFFACCKIMQRRKTEEIQGAKISGAGAIFPISGKLRIKRCRYR